MFVRLAGTRFVSRRNIPLRRFAFAARRCPGPLPAQGQASKGEFPMSPHYPIYLSKSISDDYKRGCVRSRRRFDDRARPACARGPGRSFPLPVRNDLKRACHPDVL